MGATLEVVRGDDVNIDLIITDSDGAVVDITGYKFYFTVKTNNDDTDANALITKDVTSHTDEENGETRISLTDEETAITPGNYYYDIQWKDSSALIKTISIGRFKVLQDITTRAN